MDIAVLRLAVDQVLVAAAAKVGRRHHTMVAVAAEDCRC